MAGRRRVFFFAVLLGMLSGWTPARSQPAANDDDAVRLNWYTSLSVTDARLLVAEFEKRRPGIKIHIERTHDLLERGERGTVAWAKADVVTDIDLATRAEFIAPGVFAPLELSAERTRAMCPWIQGSNGAYIYTHSARVPIVYALNAVSDGEDLDSLAVLTRPRWKGKVALLAPSDTFEADCLYRVIAGHPNLGLSWLEKMRDNDVMLLLHSSALRRAVESGVRPVGYGMMHRYAPALSIKVRAPRDGSVILRYATAINRRAPHPAAARRFIEWLLDPATRRYMAAQGISYSLLKDECAQLESAPICGRDSDIAPGEAAALRRKAWKALLGSAQSPR